MNKVFVPCKQAMTESEAAKYGEVIVLHDQSDPDKGASRLALEPDRLFAKFIRHLNTWEPDDLILLDGPLIYNAVATSILACFTNKLSFLIWMRGRYSKKNLLIDSVRTKKTWTRSLSNRKVYAINNVHSDKPAQKYGEVVYLNEEDLEEREPPTNPEKIFARMYPILAKTHKSDFLLLSGSKIENAIASSILARMHGTTNYLIFHHRKKTYLARSADFSKSRIKEMIRSRLKPKKPTKKA